MHPQHVLPRGEDGGYVDGLRRIALGKRACRIARLQVHLQNTQLLVGRRVVQPHVEQEAVELRLGQGIGARLLQRILRGQHQKQRRQRMGRAAHGDLVLLHGFEQRGLHLGGRAVDLVGQHDVVKQRAAHKAHRTVRRVEHLAARQVAGQQVGSELHPLKTGMHPRRQRLDRGGLGQPGQAFEQQVAAGEQADNQPVEQRCLADDVGAELLAQGGDFGLVRVGHRVCEIQRIERMRMG
ncbi:hypothetical protein GALL_546230 [mine drainage metagenome]|uniref:Uncharacterized protein n=1 Tax=mine drainage metagenome TaxID=410659 RepID=A0A1J5NYK5_9ZZZZ